MIRLTQRFLCSLTIYIKQSNNQLIKQSTFIGLHWYPRCLWWGPKRGGARSSQSFIWRHPIMWQALSPNTGKFGWDHPNTTLRYLYSCASSEIDFCTISRLWYCRDFWDHQIYWFIGVRPSQQRWLLNPTVLFNKNAPTISVILYKTEITWKRHRIIRSWVTPRQATWNHRAWQRPCPGQRILFDWRNGLVVYLDIGGFGLSHILWRERGYHNKSWESLPVRTWYQKIDRQILIKKITVNFVLLYGHLERV